MPELRHSSLEIEPKKKIYLKRNSVLEAFNGNCCVVDQDYILICFRSTGLYSDFCSLYI